MRRRPSAVVVAVVVVVVVGMATACLPTDALVPCGDGALCAAPKVCAPDDQCVDPEQLTACDGLADGDACELEVATGRCAHGICQISGCGDGVVDGAEVCDDRNQASGDGCRSDCAKFEVCGDGAVDEAEACDDGNGNRADGCDDCQRTTWTATATVGGDQVDATAAALGNPQGVAVDAYGAILIADTSNNRIRRVSDGGAIATLAGANGDLTYPRGVAVDGLGRVYIADTDGHRILRIDLDGSVHLVAGTGNASYSGDLAAATSAELSAPGGVAVDGLGNVFIADSGNHRLRRVDLSGVIETVAGTGIPGFNGDGPGTVSRLNQPWGIAIDAAGGVYVADRDNHRVRRLDLDGTLTTVVGTGSGGFNGDGRLATLTELYSPTGIAIAGGELYIAEINSHRIRRVVAGRVTTVAGTGVAGFSGDGALGINAQLFTPTSVAVDAAGRIIIADASNHRVRQIAEDGIITTVAGTGVWGSGGEGLAATSVDHYLQASIALDGAGGMFISEYWRDRVRYVSAAGVSTTIAGTGERNYSGDGGPATAAALRHPQGVVGDGLGRIFIADGGNHRIRMVEGGVISTIAGTGVGGYNGDAVSALAAQLSSPVGLALDAQGRLLVADNGNNRIRRIDLTAGTIETVAGPGGLASPRAVALDGTNRIHVVDSQGHQVVRVESGGALTVVAGTPGVMGSSGDGGSAVGATLRNPQDIAFDAAGRLVIADTGNHRLRVVDGGTILPWSGSGVARFSGDGGPAALAEFDGPTDVAIELVDGAEEVVISESFYVRRVRGDGSIITVAGRIDPDGMGPIGVANLAEPRALALTPFFGLVAGGPTGTVQVIRDDEGRVEVGAGRYPQPDPMGNLARFQSSFGAVGGVAWDASRNAIYLTTTSGNALHVVTVIDPADVNTWEIASLAGDASPTSLAGFADGPVALARFRAPTGLYYDPGTDLLYVADTGNHVIRMIDLGAGLAAAEVSTVAGTPATLGFAGDGAAAGAALLYQPQAITRCPDGDLFVADTGNHRVRRIGGTAGTISTVLGDGVEASSGDGAPSSSFPIAEPRGVACDAAGNVYVTSTTTVRFLPAAIALDAASGIVDGTGPVQTIYGAAPRDTFPASATGCLTGIAVVDAMTVDLVDACSGLRVQLRRQAFEPAP